MAKDQQQFFWCNIASPFSASKEQDSCTTLQITPSRHTRKQTNASWNFAPRLPKMTERTRAEQENAQLKGKNYKWAKLETYHCLQTLLLLLKFLWRWTKESFVKNQSAALYKIGHISKEKDYWSEVVEDQVWFGAYKFMLFCDGHWKVLPRSDCCIEVRNKTSSLTKIILHLVLGTRLK